MSFLTQRLNFIFWQQIALYDQLHPVFALVRLLDDNAQLGNELRRGATTTSGSIVCTNRGSCPNELICNRPS